MARAGGERAGEGERPLAAESGPGPEEGSEGAGGRRGRRGQRTYRPRRLVEPFDWALTGPARGLRSDLQELVLFPIVRTFARIRAEGKEHLRNVSGPVVLAANHASHFDCPVILAALPKRVRHRTVVVAAADYFYRSPAVGALTSLALGTVPFERHEGSAESLERVKEGLRRGWSVMIFPEGTRSRSGRLGVFKKGAAYLCIDARCAAVPIYVEGTADILPKGTSVPRPGRVRVRFGPPVAPRPSDDYDSFTRRLHDAIVALGARPGSGGGGSRRSAAQE